MGIAKAYLVTYNVGQCLGWACLLYRILPYLSDQAKASSSPHSPARNPKELYAEIGYHIRLVQTAAMLEVLHAVIGLVRSNPVITAVQIMSRLAVLWIPIHHITSSQTSPGITLMLLAWSVTEVIRYAYYVVNLLNLNVWSLTWLRYTLFIVLYPMGVTGELWCYYDSLAHLKKTNMFSMGMPNQLNFTFNSYLVAMIVMVLYLPGFPPMYQHMFVQRKKVLGNAVSAEVDRKKD